MFGAVPPVRFLLPRGRATLCLLALALALCFSPLLSAGASAAQSVPAKTGAGSAAPSLDVMIGSMLMLGFRGADLPQGDAFLAQVHAGHVGHIILFDRDVTTGGERNIISPQQVRQLTATLRAASYPLLATLTRRADGCGGSSRNAALPICLLPRAWARPALRKPAPSPGNWAWNCLAGNFC